MQIKEKISKYSNFKAFFPPHCMPMHVLWMICSMDMLIWMQKKQADLHRQACMIETSR